MQCISDVLVGSYHCTLILGRSLLQGGTGGALLVQQRTAFEDRLANATTIDQNGPPVRNIQANSSALPPASPVTENCGSMASNCHAHLSIRGMQLASATRTSDVVRLF